MILRNEETMFVPYADNSGGSVSGMGGVIRRLLAGGFSSVPNRSMPSDLFLRDQ